jgi:hypothetical protein
LLGILPSRLQSLMSMLAGRGLDGYMFAAPVSPWIGSYADTLFLPALAVSLLLVVLFVARPSAFLPRLAQALFRGDDRLVAVQILAPLNIWYHHFIFLYLSLSSWLVRRSARRS